MGTKSANKKQWGYITQGIIVIITGILLISFKQIFITKSSEIIGVFLLLDGLSRLINAIKNRKNKNKSINSALSATTELILACVLSFNADQTVVWLTNFIGGYHTLLGVINFISLVLLIKNHANNVLQHSLKVIVHIVFAVIAFSANKSSLTILNLVGAHMILIGLTYIRDGRRVFISQNKEDQLRRRIRFPMPIILSFLLPRRAISKINQFLENEFINDDIRDQHMLLKEDNKSDDYLEVLIHANQHGFGMVGHTNIAYKGKVYNFGNHDKESRYMLGLIGDGVLAIADKMDFIEVSMIGGDTVFEFKIALTKDQKIQLEEKLDQLKSDLVPWELKTKIQKKSFAALLQKNANAELYKFKRGKFRNYYVFGTNCAQLADEIIGVSGLDLLVMVGFLTPGAYFDYLNREYNKDGSIVVERKVHNRRLRKKLHALEVNIAS